MEGVANAAPVTPVAADNGAAGVTEGAQGTEGQSKQTGRDEKGRFVPSQKQADEQKPQEQQDDAVDLAIGHVKAKVPKAVADALKNLERGFHMKAQELAKAKRELDEMSKADLKELAKRRGIDPYEFAESTLAEKLEMLQMSPEQKRLREVEEENRRYKEEAEQRQKAAEEERLSKEETAAKQRLDSEIAEAWKSSGLPQDLFYVKQIAAVMLDSRRMVRDGTLEQPLTAQQAAGIVKNRFETSLSSLFGKMDPEGIHRMLGEETFNRLREWDLKRVTDKAPPTVKTAGPANPAATQPKQVKGPVSEAEWREYWKV